MNKLIEKIVERIKEYKKQWMDADYLDGIDEIIDIIQEETKAYNNGWIACSERLPDDELNNCREERGSNAVYPVLATVEKVHSYTKEKYITVNRAFYGHHSNNNGFYNDCADELKVIAWQPLPQPYKESEEE